MATQYEPIVKDSTLNTTESTPRNIADVLADETGDLVTQATAIVTKLQALINAVKPNASDIPLDPITGMSANNVQLGISELKGTLTSYQSTTSCTPSSGVSVRNFKAERTGNLVIITAQIDITSAKSNGDILLSWSGSQYEMKGYSYQVCRSTSGYYSVNCNGGMRRIECGNSGIEVSNWLSMTFVGVAKNI